MIRRVPILLVLLALAPAARAAGLSVTPDDRLLVLAPHPDDESIGAGGLIQEAVRLRADVRVVFLTSGDRPTVPPPGEIRKFLGRLGARVGLVTYGGNPGLYWGRLRMKEARKAALALGLTDDNLSFLGYPDGQTLSLWLDGWGDTPPVRGRHTGADIVPYDAAERPGAPYRPAEALRDLEAVVRAFRPTMIAVSHPADHHGDHRALYLLTIAALSDVKLSTAPLVLPYLVHYPGFPSDGGAAAWPAPLDRLERFEFRLDPGAAKRKRAAIAAHASQNGDDPFLMKFAVDREVFGDVPPAMLEPDRAVSLAGNEPGPAAVDTTAVGPAAVSWERVAWEGRDLVISFRQRRRLADGESIVISVDGMAEGRAFADMPKPRIVCDEADCRGSDRGGNVNVRHARDGNTRRVSIDWVAMGQPSRALLSLQTVLRGKVESAPPIRVVDKRPAR